MEKNNGFICASRNNVFIKTRISEASFGDLGENLKAETKEDDTSITFRTDLGNVTISSLCSRSDLQCLKW